MNNKKRVVSRKPMMVNNRPAVFLAGLLLPFAVAADIIFDGTLGDTGPGQVVVGPDGDGTITNGTVFDFEGEERGSNLFFSFSDFGLSNGESVTFTQEGSNSYSNLISRVTGVNISDIDGAVINDISGSSFYLFNPNGIVIGPGATLQISNGANPFFSFGAAQGVEFDQGGIFSADLLDELNFSVTAEELLLPNPYFSADPGDGEPAGLVIADLADGEFVVLEVLEDDGEQLQAVDNGSLQFYADNFDVRNASISGGVSSGSVSFQNSQFATRSDFVDSFVTGGETGSVQFIIGGGFFVDTTSIESKGGVSIQERADLNADLYLTNTVGVDADEEAVVSTESRRFFAGPGGGGTAGDIDIDVTNLAVRGYTINSSGSDTSGDINITADSVIIDGATAVDANGDPIGEPLGFGSSVASKDIPIDGIPDDGASDVGDVVINTDKLTLAAGSGIDATSQTGDGGEVLLNLNDGESLTGGADIFGTIDVSSDTGLAGRFEVFDVNDSGEGSGTTSVLIAGDGEILANGEHPEIFDGDGGSPPTIQIDASSLILDGGRLEAKNNSPVDGENNNPSEVRINVGTFSMLDSDANGPAEIITTGGELGGEGVVDGFGQGGNVFINASTVDIDGGASTSIIRTRAGANG
ncbi:MAG: filamentous hemagglutinin N-terminal domain-containing protein, partial [Gammaproteobacteria bacterium]